MTQTGRGGNEPESLPYRGRYVSLRPITGSDYEALRLAELDPRIGTLYRHRGTTPSPEQWLASLTQGVLCNFLVVRNGSGQVIGIVAAYQADFRNGHAYIAQYIFPDFHGVAWPLESMVIFIDYLFLVFPFRKLYGATIQNSANRFETAFGEVWIEEGRLTEHEYVNGAYVDLITVSVTRERWARHRATLEESRLLAAVEGKRPGALAMDGDKNLLRDA